MLHLFADEVAAEVEIDVVMMNLGLDEGKIAREISRLGEWKLYGRT